MGKANFTEDFKRDAVLQITEPGYPVAEVAARLGTSKYSLYEWRKRYAKPAASRDDEQASEVRRLKRERMKAIARERRWFGYRRLHVLLRREGFEVNHKRLFRLYREERLTVRRRGGRKRAIGTRAPMLIPMRPNERWSLDCVATR